MRFDTTKTLGILGGGQLGKMLVQSAMEFDLYIKSMDADPSAPCAIYAHEFFCGSLLDFDQVVQFGLTCDILTIEIEHVNVDALDYLASLGKKVFPQPSVLRKIQNKRIQKEFFVEHEIPTADFKQVTEELSLYISQFPVVQKAETGGYDGKGVQVLRTKEDISKALPGATFIENLVPFDKELAVIVARSPSGEMRTFPVVEMAFHPEANLVEYLFAPAMVSEQASIKAQEIAKKVAHALEIVGLLAVEMFLLPDGEILVNECAPRPHNSGHQTMRANHTSQFEQHIRAILDLPLGDTDSFMPAAMVNILGEDNHTGTPIYEGMDILLATSGIHPFLYGKKITKPFRKMGHVTITGKNTEELKEKVDLVKNHLRVISHQK
ncbi:MAG: 5-(carboxyamino)imidazole ribonucleotide synthase [Spirosomataceae bacterium]